MKKITILICLLVFSVQLFCSQLIHAYFGDYREVVRVVFVFPRDVHYSTLMDTDNRNILIHVSATALSPSLLNVDFSSTELISHVTFEPQGRDLRIALFTNVVFYAETFLHRDDTFKIVVDVFRQREPRTLDQAHAVLNFYETVGYHERARALRRRINNNEFPSHAVAVHQQERPVVVTRPVEPPPVVTRRVEPSPPVPISGASTVTTGAHENPLQYIKPDISFLNSAQQSWITEAFRVYDMFRHIHQMLEQAERVLRLYDAQTVVDISFVESMSQSHNSLSSANIQLNEIRLQFHNLRDQRNVAPHTAVAYTERMINHILGVLNAYQSRTTNLQIEYNRRINR